MPRTARIAPGGVIFHVLNRANARTDIFGNDGDYLAFQRVLSETCQQIRLRILCYCLMPNHWHLVLWPRKDGQLAAFMQRVTTTHVRRWRLLRGTVGWGHLYQGTYKSFPIQRDRHFLTVCRYVERNALRAGLVTRAEDWRWSSLWGRTVGAEGHDAPPLRRWPVASPPDWIKIVNTPQTAQELQALRLSVSRGRPFGAPAWQKRTAGWLRLESTFRPPGRPMGTKTKGK